MTSGGFSMLKLSQINLKKLLDNAKVCVYIGVMKNMMAVAERSSVKSEVNIVGKEIRMHTKPTTAV